MNPQQYFVVRGDQACGPTGKKYQQPGIGRSMTGLGLFIYTGLLSLATIVWNTFLSRPAHNADYSIEIGVLPIVIVPSRVLPRRRPSLKSRCRARHSGNETWDEILWHLLLEGKKYQLYARGISKAGLAQAMAYLLTGLMFKWISIKKGDIG